MTLFDYIDIWGYNTPGYYQWLVFDYIDIWGYNTPGYIQWLVFDYIDIWGYNTPGYIQWLVFDYIDIWGYNTPDYGFVNVVSLVFRPFVCTFVGISHSGFAMFRCHNPSMTIIQDITCQYKGYCFWNIKYVYSIHIFNMNINVSVTRAPPPMHSVPSLFLLWLWLRWLSYRYWSLWLWHFS